ncbi:MAG: hypothetical protein QXJ06_05415 [Candidatus Aenigmatarchaeota archaeon]
MLPPTHILSTLIIIKIFGVQNQIEFFLCIFFGVLIDLDELYTIFLNFKKMGFNKFYNSSLKRMLKRRTWFQESGGLFISFFISFFVGSFIPFICNLIHCILDWASYYKSNPFAPFYSKIETQGFIKTFSLEEFLITLLFLIIFLYL